MRSLASTPRASRYAGTRYEAWYLSDAGWNARMRPLEATTLQEAVNAAQGSCSHKAKLVIKAINTETGEAVLHVYVIRKAAPKWVHPNGEILPRRVEDHYAELVATVPAEVLR